MKIHGSQIRVEVRETYQGSQHCHCRVRLPGFGADHPGFVLVSVEKLQEAFGEHWSDYLGDITLRPEYADAIRKLRRTSDCGPMRQLKGIASYPPRGAPQRHRSSCSF